jgi:hypothetical protein
MRQIGAVVWNPRLDQLSLNLSSFQLVGRDPLLKGKPGRHPGSLPGERGWRNRP